MIFLPPQVSIIKEDAVSQKNNFFLGENFELVFNVFFNGKIKRITILATRAITPPNLLGIERKIAYANKKYHSG